MSLEANVLFFFAVSFTSYTLSKGADGRPNFVIFLADDLGIGDLSCFGNLTMKTPNIDHICRHGVKMEHNLAPESICTPSRAAFLTGRYAIRSGLANDEYQLRNLIHNSASGGLPQSEMTFATALRSVGYYTAIVGKWHVGLSCKTKDDFCHHPMNHGFDYYYGIPLTNLRDCQPDNFKSVFNHAIYGYRQISTIIFSSSIVLLLTVAALGTNNHRKLLLISPLLLAVSTSNLVVQWLWKIDYCVIMRKFEVVEQPVFGNDITQRFTSDAVRIIENQTRTKPFLLFISFSKVHTALHTTEAFTNHSAHGRFGDNVEEMDWAVGAVLSALDRKGFLNSTFVYFTSDHGPHLEETSETGEYEGGSKGNFKGGKGSVWEGGIRVPTVALWPGIFPPGRIIQQPTSSMDVFTTIIELAGASLPTDRHIDGKNIFHLLTGKANITPHESIFHYCGKALHAVTYISKTHSEIKLWKLYFKTPIVEPGFDYCPTWRATCQCYEGYVVNHDPPLLYSMDKDPFEHVLVDNTSEQYKDILHKIQIQVINHESTITAVPSQLGENDLTLSKILCCNFPFCSCKEDFPFKRIPMNTSFL